MDLSSNPLLGVPSMSHYHCSNGYVFKATTVFFYLVCWMRIMRQSRKDHREEDEKKVLSELMKNSKENIETIAKHCGFSRQKAWRIIKQLETDQKIWGYSVALDNEKQDLEKFMLFVKRTKTQHNQNDIDEIVQNLLAAVKKDLGVTVISSYFIHGEYDWVLIFTAKDIRDAKKFSETMMLKFPGKQLVHISQILYTVRENYIRNPNILTMKEFI